MDIYQTVTDRIISLIESGTIPWRKTWAAGGGGMPKNLVSKKEYRGINIFLLSAMPFSSPYWLTYKQATDLGGHVKRGEKSTPVIFWKVLDKHDQDDDTKAIGKIPMLKHYNLFSAEQCEGIPVPPDPEETVNPFTPIERAEQIIAGYFKEICGQDGWLNKLSLYRDLVMHACPLSMPKQRVWIRCEATELLGGKLLPRIVAPIPNDPLDLKTERNSFEFFRDFQKQADDFFGKSNNLDTSIDLLEYSCVVMDEFSELLWLCAEQSPLEGEIMSFGPHNTLNVEMLNLI
jgi:hypothetical protein